MTNIGVTASVDKLTLLVDGIDDEGIARLEPFLHFRTGGDGPNLSQGVYKHNAKIGNVWVEHRGIREEYSTPSDLRIEFNPNNLEKGDEDVLRSLLSRGKVAKVSRVDIALDVVGDGRMEHLGWHLNGAKSWKQWGNGDRIETWYLGSGQSQKMLRVYDKGRKERERYDWWRIEMQHRPSGKEPLPENLFDKVRPLGIPSEWDPVANFNEYAIATAMALYPVVRYACQSDKRQRWLKRLELAGREVIKPDEVYRKHRPALVAVLEHWQGQVKTERLSAN